MYAMIKFRTTTLFVLCLFFGVSLTTYAQQELDDTLSQAELDQLLAPIALYPDTLLSHIFIASTYPLEVVQAERWTRENSDLKGDDALDAVESKDWDPSVKALVAFPQVLERMSDNLEWTSKLGEAFLQDEALVLASVQDLRQRANDEGSLADLDHYEVVEDDNDNIVIESRVKEVVYVPVYDTRVVYGRWWWDDYPPVYWSGVRAGISFHWGPRIYVGTRIYFSSFHWLNRHVVVVDRYHHKRHRFYTGRHVVRHANARKWVHNPHHRRGVHYRHSRLRNHYGNHVNRRVSLAERARAKREATIDRRVDRRLNDNRSVERRANNTSRSSEREVANQRRAADSNRLAESKKRNVKNRDTSRVSEARQQQTKRNSTNEYRRESKQQAQVARTRTSDLKTDRSRYSNHVKQAQRSTVKTNQNQRQYRQDKSSRSTSNTRYSGSSNKSYRSSSTQYKSASRSSRASSGSSRNTRASRER